MWTAPQDVGQRVLDISFTVAALEWSQSSTKSYAPIFSPLEGDEQEQAGGYSFIRLARMRASRLYVAHHVCVACTFFTRLRSYA